MVLTGAVPLGMALLTPPYTSENPITVRQNDHVVIYFSVGFKGQEKREVQTQSGDITDVAMHLGHKIREYPPYSMLKMELGKTHRTNVTNSILLHTFFNLEYLRRDFPMLVFLPQISCVWCISG